MSAVELVGFSSMTLKSLTTKHAMISYFPVRMRSYQLMYLSLKGILMTNIRTKTNNGNRCGEEGKCLGIDDSAKYYTKSPFFKDAL